MQNKNPYLHLTLEQLAEKLKLGSKWLRENNKHPKFFEYLKKYRLLYVAWQQKDREDEMRWCAETVAHLQQIIPGISEVDGKSKPDTMKSGGYRNIPTNYQTTDLWGNQKT